MEVGRSHHRSKTTTTWPIPDRTSSLVRYSSRLTLIYSRDRSGWCTRPPTRTYGRATCPVINMLLVTTDEQVCGLAAVRGNERPSPFRRPPATYTFIYYRYYTGTENLKTMTRLNFIVPCTYFLELAIKAAWVRLLGKKTMPCPMLEEASLWETRGFSCIFWSRATCIETQTQARIQIWLEWCCT